MSWSWATSQLDGDWIFQESFYDSGYLSCQIRSVIQSSTYFAELDAVLMRKMKIQNAQA